MASMLTPFVIWLLCVGIAALAIGLLLKTKDTESFLDSGIRITACPAQTTTYITERGDTNCCDGDIVDGKCGGTDVCSLSPSDMSSKGVMSCNEWITREWAKRSNRFCAPSLPYYFGTMRRKHGDKEGCSASACSSDGSKPQDSTKPTCKIYQSSVDEYGRADSCFNMRARDEMSCPIPKATKEIVYTGLVKGKLMPALLRCTYIPPNGSSMNIPVHCNNVPRFKTYINATLDKETSQYSEVINSFIDSFSVKDVNFCPASKAFYVDGTLERKDAFGIPGSGSAGTINLQGGIDPPASACPSGGSIPDGADPRCYVNGALVGTLKNNRMEYTDDQCKSIGGTKGGTKGAGSSCLPSGVTDDPFLSDSKRFNGICVPFDPRCYVNGVKLGKTLHSTNPEFKPDNFNGYMLTYTKDECKKLGGIYAYDPGAKQGMCFIKGVKRKNGGDAQYNILCSPHYGMRNM